MMNDRDRAIAVMNEELERLRRRVAELESRTADAGGPDDSLRATLLQQHAILDNIPDMAWLKDTESRYIAVNGSYGEACGMPPAALVGKTDQDIWPRDLAEGYRADDIEVMSSRKRKRVEERLVGPDGREQWIETIKTPILDDKGSVIGTTGIARNISERRQAEARLRNVSRLYAFLIQISQAIVRTRDRDELFQAICRVAIDFGEFKMAWIGLVNEASGIVLPVTHAGQDDGYLNVLKIRINDQATSKGPTGSALREGALVICDDIATDSRMQPWRDEALKRGYRSSAAIPFRQKGKIIGSLNLYAPETGFFTEDERELLAEIGVEISFALDTMEGEKERRQAEEALLESKERYRSFFDNAAVAVAIVDLVGHVVDANEADCRFLGYPRSELIGMHFAQFTHPQDMELDVALYQALLSGQRTSYEIEKRYIRKDGETVWGRLAVSFIRDSRGVPLYTLVVCVDITERKRAQEALRDNEERLQFMMSNSPSVIYTCRPSGDFGATFVSTNVLQQLGYGAHEFIADAGFWASHIHPEDAQRVFNGVTALFAEGSHAHEYRFRHKDGTWRWMHDELRLIRNAAGEPVEILGSWIDITDRKRAEEALRESERKYRTLFDSASDAVFILDLDGNILDVNRTAHTRLGYTKQEMLAMHVTRLDPPEFAARVPERLAQMFRSGEAVFESAHLRKDGSVMPVEINGRLLEYEGRQVFFSIVRDISERKRMEETLKESEEKFRSVFDSASDGILLVDPHSKRFVLGNATIARMLGVGQDDLPRMKVEDIHPHEALPYVFQSFEKVAQGETLFSENLPVRRKDGSVFFADIATSWITLKGVTYMAGFFRDITERKRAEEAIKESEERFRTLLARVDSVAVQGFGPDGVVHYWNKASERLYGYSAEEAKGRSILDLIVPPELREQVANAIAQMAATASPLPSSEVSLLCKNGSCVMVQANYAVVNMPGRSPELYCIDIDLTERKRSEQERLDLERRLLHAQKLESLGVLAGGIAHDFNNLLMAVLGNLDLALRKVPPDSPARLNIEQSAQAARRATDLTRQMLAYSGRGSFVVKAMDLSELVEENTHLFRSSVARTATLDVRLGRSLPSIEADAGQVQQVIMNLITNASEAIGAASGTITITTGVQEYDAQSLKRSRNEDAPPPGRFVYLEVSDTGCGMDEQTKQRLFDPFFTTKSPGRGLGMSAILGIVRGHGGAIFVESSTGKGTSIRILFPAFEGLRVERGEPARVRTAEAGTPAVNGKVLVVDDEEIVRMVCRDMVEALGLTVLTAVDGRDAVDILTKHADEIAVVILDLSMPNMDGMTTFQELVRIRPGVKVILSSGYDELDSIKRLSSQGLAGFIQKPYSLNNLRDALESAGRSGG